MFLWLQVVYLCFYGYRRFVYVPMVTGGVPDVVAVVP